MKIQENVNITRHDDLQGKNFLIKSSGLMDYEKKGASSFLSLKYVKKGVENYIVDKQVYSVKANNFILINPKQQSTFYVKSATETDGICFFFDEELIQQITLSHTRSERENLSQKGQENKLSIGLYL